MQNLKLLEHSKNYGQEKSIWVLSHRIFRRKPFWVESKIFTWLSNKKVRIENIPPLTKFAQHVLIISVSIKTIFFIFRGKPFDGINNFECISHKIQLWIILQVVLWSETEILKYVIQKNISDIVIEINMSNKFIKMNDYTTGKLFTLFVMFNQHKEVIFTLL